MNQSLETEQQAQLLQWADAHRKQMAFAGLR